MSVSASPVHSIHEYGHGIYKVVTFKGVRDPDNVSAVPGLAGVDFCWVGGCLAFLILFYSFFRLLGGVFLGRSK